MKVKKHPGRFFVPRQPLTSDSRKCPDQPFMQAAFCLSFSQS